MTIQVPPTEAVNDISIKDKTPIVDEQEHTTPVTTAVIEKKDVEPTLTTQVEPPLAATTLEGEESHLASTSTEDKPKRKGLFNNPFANKVKKDSEEAITTLNDTAETSENKISKGFGNFLSKVKQTASSNNIKELSDPTPTTTAEGETVHEREVVHENTTTAADTTETHDLDNNVNNNNKRQSILSKLFGGGNNNNANKKKEEATTAAEETDRSVEPDTTTTDQHQAETEETSPSSPPLSRRVTGFFTKKMPKLDKKQKSSTNTEKVETTTSPTTEAFEDKNVTISAEEPHVVTDPTPVTAAKEVEETPVVKVTETTPVDTTTTNNNATTA